MSLIDYFVYPCVFMIPHETPDGSGGHTTVWEQGQAFMAAIYRDTSMESRIAEAAGTVSNYTVTVSKDIHLPYHTVIKRLYDNKIFRITSDNSEKKTPKCSTLSMAQSTAEEWRLPE